MRDMYINSLDLKHSVSAKGHYVFTLPKHKPPSKSSSGETVYYFREIKFNSKKDFMGVKWGGYKKRPQLARLGRIRHTKDRQIIGMEIIKDHVFGDPLF